MCAQQRLILNGDSDWCWVALGCAGSRRRDWGSGRTCGLGAQELPVALPGAGSPLGLHGVTFLHTPSDEVDVNMKMILSIIGSLNTPGFLSNADL